MAKVWFYEKPGCINNTRQKKLLMQAGHDVISHNLLEVKWDKTYLKKFFTGLPVNEWFNNSAPAIKDGLVNPETLDEDQAITLLLSEPILIRRPLMCVGDEYRVGFDADTVNEWIGLAGSGARDGKEDLETCVRQR